MCFDKLKVAEQFNMFFITVASSLVNKLPQGTGKFGDDHVSSFYQGKDVIPNAFCLKEVNVDNINQILNSMSANKATGLDDLSARFINDGARVIAPMITHIVNMSIRQGIIPDDIKKARVIPIHKKVVGQIPVCIDLYPYSVPFQKSWRRLDTIRFLPIQSQMVSCTNSSQDSDSHFQLTLVLFILHITLNPKVISVTIQAWYC